MVLSYMVTVLFVGVAKSLATDGGKVITLCIFVQCKRRFGLFASPSCFIDLQDMQHLFIVSKSSIYLFYKPQFTGDNYGY